MNALFFKCLAHCWKGAEYTPINDPEPTHGTEHIADNSHATVQPLLPENIVTNSHTPSHKTNPLKPPPIGTITSEKRYFYHLNIRKSASLNESIVIPFMTKEVVDVTAIEQAFQVYFKEKKVLKEGKLDDMPDLSNYKLVSKHIKNMGYAPQWLIVPQDLMDVEIEDDWYDQYLEPIHRAYRDLFLPTSTTIDNKGRIVSHGYHLVCLESSHSKHASQNDVSPPTTFSPPPTTSRRKRKDRPLSVVHIKDNSTYIATPNVIDGNILSQLTTACTDFFISTSHESIQTTIKQDLLPASSTTPCFTLQASPYQNGIMTIISPQNTSESTVHHIIQDMTYIHQQINSAIQKNKS